MSILTALNNSVKQFTENYSKLCIVRSISEYQLTIDVEPLDSNGYNFYTPNKNNYILNVRLGPRIEVFGKSGTYKIPSLNSLVIVSFLDKENAFVSLYSTLSNVNMKAQNINFNLTDGVFIDNCDSFKIQTITDIVTLKDTTETNTEFVVENISNILISTPIDDLKIIPEGIEFNSHTQKIYIGKKVESSEDKYNELKRLYNKELVLLNIGLYYYNSLLSYADIVSIYNENFMDFAYRLLAIDIDKNNNSIGTLEFTIDDISKTIDNIVKNSNNLKYEEYQGLTNKRLAYDWLIKDYRKKKANIIITYNTLKDVENYINTESGLKEFNKTIINVNYIMALDTESSESGKFYFDYNWINENKLKYFNGNTFYDDIFENLASIDIINYIKSKEISGNIFPSSNNDYDSTLLNLRPILEYTELNLGNENFIKNLYITELETTLALYGYNLTEDDRIALSIGIEGQVNTVPYSAYFDFCTEFQKQVVKIYKKALDQLFIEKSITTTDENLKKYLNDLINIIKGLTVVDTNGVISPISNIPAYNAIQTKIVQILK